MKNSSVDKFVSSAKQWQEEISALRAILLKTKLQENFKWNLPCYSHNESNVVIVQPFKKCLGLMFFKGSLLKDPKKVLVNNGPNSQAAKRLEFHSVEEIGKMKATINAYVKEAIAIEDKGEKVAFKKTPQAMPAELKKVFAVKPKVKSAFTALTPGRQRAYILHFSSAKQSATRVDRIEKCIPKILKGKGLTDR